MCIPYDRRRIGMAYGRSDFKVTETVYRQCQWCRCRHSRESTRPRELSRVSYQAGNFMGNLSRISERRRSSAAARGRARRRRPLDIRLSLTFLWLYKGRQKKITHITHSHTLTSHHSDTSPRTTRSSRPRRHRKANPRCPVPHRPHTRTSETAIHRLTQHGARL